MKEPTIHFRQLKQFEAIVRNGSLTLAAAELNLTIPALSKSLQTLEAHLGTRLVERGARGTRPTAAGAALLAHARLASNFLAAAQQAVDEATAAADSRISIGAAPGAAQAVLPAAVAALRQLVPAVRITVREGLSDLPQAVRVGDIDIALVAASAEARHADLASTVVFSERVIVLGSSREPARQTLAQLTARDWVLPASGNPLRAHLEARFAAAGAGAPRVAVETASTLFATALIERGDTLGYLPEALCRTQLHTGSLREVRCPGLSWRRDVVAIHHARLPLPGAARTLLKILRRPGGANA